MNAKGFVFIVLICSIGCESRSDSFVSLESDTTPTPQSSPEAISQKLIDGMKGEDFEEIIAILYRDHKQAIQTHWTTIRVVPETYRRNPMEAIGYALAIMALATYFEEQGDPSLLNSLSAQAEAKPASDQ